MEGMLLLKHTLCSSFYLPHVSYVGLREEKLHWSKATVCWTRPWAI